MTSDVDATYAELHAVLERLGPHLGTAESHGLLCGMLCAGGSISVQEWLAEVVDDAVADEAVIATLTPTLGRVVEAAARSLRSPDFEFVPLLPADETPLAVRASALGEWCRGFLYGLGVGGFDGTEGLDAEVREALADLAEITRIAYDPDEAGDDTGETDYAELVEYVRIAVLVVNEEVGDEGPALGAGPVVH